MITTAYQRIVFVTVIAATVSGLSVAAENDDAKLAGLLHNEDCTDFFYNAVIPTGKAGEVIDCYVDVIADAGVTVLLCNVNARRTNYRSDVWEAFWDGYDSEKGETDPFLTPIAPDLRKAYAKLIGNMHEVHRQGVDYPARVVERCRRRGMSPWISLRMNDVHENDNLDHPFHSVLWQESKLFRKGHPGYYARALDYKYAEVRDHYRALIVEVLQRYDVDGLELDFMREPYLFSKGEEPEGSKTLTRWLREIRELVDQASERRAHPVKLGVRVPSEPRTALGLGLDAPTWSKDRLVDLVVATPRWETMHFDIPLAEWKRLLGNDVTLAGGLETRYCHYPGSPVEYRNAECAAGAAVAVLSQGADVVYLFNHFQNGWPQPGYARLLNAMSSLDKLQELPRRHAVTFRQVHVPGEAYRAPLPVTGQAMSFHLPLGPPPRDSWKAVAVIEIANKDAQAPRLSINGVECARQEPKDLSNGHRQLTYSIPIDALPGRSSDTIIVTATGEKAITVFRVEVRLHAGS
jgi:hypothetical protein